MNARDIEVKASSNRRIAQSCVAVVLLAIVIAVFVPYLRAALLKGELLTSVSRTRFLYLAVYNMAIDGEVNHNPALGWPGDVAKAADPRVRADTVSSFLKRLVDYDYLKPADLGSFCSGPGVARWNGTAPFEVARHCAWKIYTVGKRDGAATLFLASRNFTYNAPLDEDAKPYGRNGFVVMRMGGDGAFLKEQQAWHLQVVGLLPGRTDYTQNPHEMPGDTLLPR
jgi:hypothetical protein